MKQSETTITREKAETLLLSKTYTFAKSMPWIPHYYTLRKNWEIDSDFCDVVVFIRKWGLKENFGKRTFTYYYLDGWKYWTMNEELSYTDKNKTFIINRCKVEPQIFQRNFSIQNENFKIENPKGFGSFFD